LSRYQALQQRRALEIEGFHTDIRQLRDSMRRVEKQWSLVHGVVADAALLDQVRELDRAYAAIVDRTAAAAALSDPAAAGMLPPPLPLQISMQQQQQRPSQTRYGGSGGDPVDATRSRGGGEQHYAGLVYPPKQIVEPAPGSAAVRDPGTRSRLRMKSALLQDNPVVYRVVRKWSVLFFFLLRMLYSRTPFEL
jgi:hypothetical protein